MVDDLALVAAVGLAAAAGIVVGAVFGPGPLRGTRFEPPSDPAASEPDARFEQLLRSLTVGIITIGSRGTIESVNAAASAIFDFGARGVVGRAMIEVVPSFDLDRRVNEALAGHPSRGRVSLSDASGPRILNVATLPLDGNGSGAVAGVLVIASDETRLHELERTRREFVTSVSHELRTPLSSITLMIETVLMDENDAEARALFLPRIKSEVDRMVQLVQDLLELARAESGRLRLRRENVDLSSVANNIVKTFEQRAQQLGVKLKLESTPARIDGDPDRLAQVLVNLIENALRHTPSGGTIEISISPRDGAATLVIRDTGVGIPYNDLPHIFERFYVVDRSRAREAAGTGLGLSIVKQIVEAHGGTIVAESEFGLGATFTIVFPLTRTTAGAA